MKTVFLLRFSRRNGFYSCERLQDVEAEVVLRMICLNEAETDAQTPPDGYGQVLIEPPENFPSWAAYMEFISEQAFNEAKKRQETDEK